VNAGSASRLISSYGIPTSQRYPFGRWLAGDEASGSHAKLELNGW
jgi:hypothetical protein